MSALFSIYRSSAGSGKTRTLAKEYLKLALRFRAGYFKHILAVTFTNKSTQEMKDRILSYLNDFSSGVQNDLSRELQKELSLDAATFQNYAQEVRSEILHHYAQFSISTIDAFFQKVIRSFTREAGLAGDYRLEVEQGPILVEVIDNLIDELGNNEILTNWVVEFANENLMNDRAWDVRSSLLEFSQEIFKEEFKSIEGELNQRSVEKTFFPALLSEFKKTKFLFLNTIKAKANEAILLIQQLDVDLGDFKYAGGGAYSYLIKLSALTSVNDFNDEKKGKRSEKEYQLGVNWPNKDSPHQSVIQQLAEDRLIPLLNEILEFRDKNFSKALSAEVALSNFYAFGLIADISRKLKEYKDENSVMLLADASQFLSGVINDSDTPFIYEKVGSFYKNFLIDEFQDTSRLQWQNFLPLLNNGLDQGYPSLVVGDVKQAVYRWRGGDLNLLQREVETHIGDNRTELKNLNQNFRSAKQVVEFNNAIFKSAAQWVSRETGHAISAEAYIDIEQVISKDENGFVELSFINSTDGDQWKDIALQQVPKHLERLQQLGAELKDIAILVRKNEEGQQIVAHLLQYKNSTEALPDCKYDVVSNESLRLDGAASVNLLVSSLKYLLNTEDAIARAQLGYEYARMCEPERELTEVFAVANQINFENNLPGDFSKQKVFLKKLPLFELTETLIGIFNLGKCIGELSYLQTFQNLVLDFTSRERNDLGAFLEWWEDNKAKKSIQVSGEVNAAQILTVHKSKGLQFKYVIIPFCAWSLDHSMPVALWVKSDEQPFAKAGPLPVRYSGALKETLFASYYEEERARCYLDNLNLLYVALTRAEHGLIVTASHPDNRNVKGTVSNVLYHSIENSSSLHEGWNPATSVWKSGDWSLKISPKKSEANHAISLTNYYSSSWRDKLVIKQSSKEHFQDPTETSKKVRYGIHLHTILSRIKYQDELQDAFDHLLLEGVITAREKPEIEILMNELFANPVIADWFTTVWEVRTEVPVLLPGEGDSRIDRLMIRDAKAVVVDFKTGEPYKSDSVQVASYIDTLHKMNFTEVDGFLLYIKTGEIVSVPPGKAIKSHKKDDSQLGLGF